MRLQLPRIAKSVVDGTFEVKIPTYKKNGILESFLHRSRRTYTLEDAFPRSRQCFRSKYNKYVVDHDYSK